jgi:hypothetical protein
MKNELYEHLKGNRGVGHTRLMMDGARNANYPFFIIGANSRQAAQLAADTQNSFAIPMTIDSNRLFGQTHPILIDGHAFTTMSEVYMRENRDNKEARIKAEEKLALNQAGIKKIEALPFWIRLFTPLYKRAINKHTL